MSKIQNVEKQGPLTFSFSTQHALWLYERTRQRKQGDKRERNGEAQAKLRARSLQNVFFFSTANKEHILSWTSIIRDQTFSPSEIKAMLLTPQIVSRSPELLSQGQERIVLSEEESSNSPDGWRNTHYNKSAALLLILRSHDYGLLTHSLFLKEQIIRRAELIRRKQTEEQTDGLRILKRNMICISRLVASWLNLTRDSFSLLAVLVWFHTAQC